MMLSKEMFKLGDKVRFSSEGIIKLKPQMSHRYGIVVGFSRKDEDIVRIRWDGLNSSQTYFCGFLELVK